MRNRARRIPSGKPRFVERLPRPVRASAHRHSPHNPTHTTAACETQIELQGCSTRTQGSLGAESPRPCPPPSSPPLSSNNHGLSNHHVAPTTTAPSSSVLRLSSTPCLELTGAGIQRLARTHLSSTSMQAHSGALPDPYRSVLAAIFDGHEATDEGVDDLARPRPIGELALWTTLLVHDPRHAGETSAPAQGTQVIEVSSELLHPCQSSSSSSQFPSCQSHQCHTLFSS